MSFDSKRDGRALVIMASIFLLFYWVPFGHPRVSGAILESFHLAGSYARDHVLLCLIPAFFIAGAIGVFISQAAVLRYLGAEAKRVVAYGVAAVSGTVLAVCSCTVLPLFGGIYKRGAGLGPACAFLYSGPAINVLAIVMTARVLGWELGLARAVGAVLFSVVIGLLMAWIFRKEEASRHAGAMMISADEPTRSLRQEVLFFGVMVLILVFANWGAPNQWQVETLDGTSFTGAIIGDIERTDADAPLRFQIDATEDGAQPMTVTLSEDEIAHRSLAPSLWASIHAAKWWVTGILGLAFAVILGAWFAIPWWRITVAVVPVVALALFLPGHPVVPFFFASLALAVLTATGPEESRDWFDASWGFTKQILPLLFGGVLIAGLLLGRPENEGLIPSSWVQWAVGGNSIAANAFAAVAGAFMYFATLTEIPILEGLRGGAGSGGGMGDGPALALLLAGPALSLPNMLVINTILGWRKTAVFVVLVIVMAMVSGIVFGALMA